MKNLNLTQEQIIAICSIVQSELENRYEKLVQHRETLPFSRTQVVELTSVVDYVMNEFNLSVSNKLRELNKID